jgi:hypothetical protein
MKYAVDIGSGAMIFIPCFIETGTDIQTAMGGGCTDSILIA